MVWSFRIMLFQIITLQARMFVLKIRMFNCQTSKRCLKTVPEEIRVFIILFLERPATSTHGPRWMKFLRLNVLKSKEGPNFITCSKNEHLWIYMKLKCSLKPHVPVYYYI